MSDVAQGCNPIIVSTFAKVAHQTNFAYCFSIIEANQQRSHAQARSASSHSLNATANTTPSRQRSQPSNPSLTLPRQARQSNVDAGLDNYFPFDPYDLPRSKRWIDRIYRTWDEVAINSGVDSESNVEESDEETEEDDSAGADSVFEDRLSNGQSLPKMRNGTLSDARRRLLSKDGGLSSSLEGMVLGPGLTRLMG